MENRLEEYSLWLTNIFEKLQKKEDHNEIINLCEKYQWLEKTIIPTNNFFPEDENGYNTVHLLVRFSNSDEDYIRLLQKFSNTMMYSQTSFGNSPLYFAVKQGANDFHQFVMEYFSVNKLLSQKKDIVCDGIKNRHNESITHTLARYGDDSIKSILLDHSQLHSLIFGSEWEGYNSLFDTIKKYGGSDIQKKSSQYEKSIVNGQESIRSDYVNDQFVLTYDGKIFVEVRRDNQSLIVKYRESGHEGESLYDTSANDWIGALYYEEFKPLVQLYLLREKELGFNVL